MMARIKMTGNKYSREFDIEKENGEKMHVWFTGSWKLYQNEKKVEEFLRDVEKVEGNTYPFRQVLKQFGFNWNAKEKAWEKITKEEADQAWREKKIEEEKELLETMAKTFADMMDFDTYWNKRKDEFKYITENEAREIWKKYKI